MVKLFRKRLNELKVENASNSKYSSLLRQFVLNGIFLKKLVVCCAVICLCSAHLNAQTRGKLEIVKDSRIDSLIAHRYSTNKVAVKSGGLMSTRGYRVQFFSGSSRKEAFSAQSKFQQLYPQLRTYITYNEPNFKVKAGDFRTRLEATQLMQHLKSRFTSLFILSDKINPPKLDSPIP